MSLSRSRKKLKTKPVTIRGMRVRIPVSRFRLRFVVMVFGSVKSARIEVVSHRRDPEGETPRISLALRRYFRTVEG
jgi:hypothetical protein